MQKDEFYKDLGEKIKKYRKEANFTQKQISKEIGVDQGRWSRYETGQNRINTYELHKLKKILKKVILGVDLL